MKKNKEMYLLLKIVSVVITVAFLFSACGKVDNTTVASDTAKAAASSGASGASAAEGSSSAASQGGAEEYKYGKLQIQALGGGACGAPTYVAFEKGFFAEEGLDVELTSGTFDNLRTGLGTGKFTVANGDFQFFSSIQSGLKLRVIGGLHKGCIRLIVPKDSPIKTSKDLAGKRIGVDEIGGTPMSVTSIILANAGIDPSKGVTWKTYPLDQLATAAKKGEIDAFAVWDPFGVLAEKNDGFIALSDISTDPLFAGKSCCFLYASQKQIDKNPDRVAAIARAYKKATEWILAHPEETAQLEIDKKYVSGTDLKLLTELIKSYNYEYTTTVAKDDVRYFVEQLNKTGFLRKDTDPQKFADDVYYDVFNKQ